MSTRIRPIRTSDYRPVLSVIADWWGGRHMADMLPRLFFEHFTDTSFAAERDGTLIGFPVTTAYDGDRQDRVRFVKHLTE